MITHCTATLLVSVMTFLARRLLSSAPVRCCAGGQQWQWQWPGNRIHRRRHVHVQPALATVTAPKTTGGCSATLRPWVAVRALSSTSASNSNSNSTNEKASGFAQHEYAQHYSTEHNASAFAMYADGASKGNPVRAVAPQESLIHFASSRHGSVTEIFLCSPPPTPCLPRV